MTIGALRQPLVQRALRLAPPPARHDSLRQQILGLAFDHPIGLAAGLDKQGAAIAAWEAIGLAFAEIGTVTPRPQPGNPRPRLFRLRDDRAIINRFGFNSTGAEGVARNLAAQRASGIRVGVNVGKNKETPNERAAEDYVLAVHTLHPFADYFVINVSSPNTSGLRDLQEHRALRALVEAVVRAVHDCASPKTIPVLVKVSPDMAPADLLQSVEAAVEGGAAGVVATNTTLARHALKAAPSLAGETGGLSGAPLRQSANDACRLIFAQFRGRVPIVGVGGIFSADDAYQRIRSGASLLQVYTGLIYEGPDLVPRALNGLAERLQRDGFAHVAEAIGIDVH